MHALTLGPHRGADWLSHSAIGGREARIDYESYIVRVIEPSSLPGHGRALWLRFRLNGQTARCEAMVFSPQPAEQKLASETWPLVRTLLDPARGGLGIGECQLESESSHGLLRGADFAVSWRFYFAGGAGAHPLLGHAKQYLPGKLQHKAALLGLGASVERGDLEIWHSLDRFARVTRISLAGWQVSCWHIWGRTSLAGLHIIDVPKLTGDAGALGAISFSTANWWRSCRPELGVWQQSERSVPLYGTGQLRRAQALRETAAGSWPVSLVGPQGELRGHVTVPLATARHAPAESAAGDAVWLWADGQFAGTYRPRGGQPRELAAERVFVESSVPPSALPPATAP